MEGKDNIGGPRFNGQLRYSDCAFPGLEEVAGFDFLATVREKSGCHNFSQLQIIELSRHRKAIVTVLLLRFLGSFVDGSRASSLSYRGRIRSDLPTFAE
jgi:hypothetical protein